MSCSLTMNALHFPFVYANIGIFKMFDNTSLVLDTAFGYLFSSKISATKQKPCYKSPGILPFT